MNFWTPENLASVTGGRLRLGQGRVALNGLNTDSRSIGAGQVFLALRGERFDGHGFVGQAAAAGAGLIVIDREESAGAAAGANVLVVADTRRALGAMAAAYRLERGRTGTRVIAVCGSNGKTTTTRMIDAVLGGALKGTASKKSFNNDIGVPLTILSAKPGDKYLLCEVGSNAPGEIATLGAIVRPDIAVITSIGREHLQGFGDLAGVAREEAAILGFIEPGGTAVVTADASELRPHLAGVKARVQTFGRAEDASLRLGDCRHASDGSGVGLEFSTAGGGRWRLGMLGLHNAGNALAAIAVARAFGLKDDVIAAGLVRARGAEMRLEVADIHGLRVINDAYNANPESMLAALATFSAVAAAPAKRAVVLGDMRELGDATEASHREIGRAVAASGVDLAVLVGPSMRWAAEEARRGAGVEWLAGTSDEDFMAAAAMLVGARAEWALVKGSRGMRMERVIEALKTRARQAGEGLAAANASG